MSMAGTWFTAGTAASGTAEIRLYCFPYAGGNAASFQPWQGLLGPAVELRVASLPGRGMRLFEPPVAQLEDLVSCLAEAVAGDEAPFAFFGHSLGALVAFEVARALRRAGRGGPVSLWVSGAEGPQTRHVRRRFHDLPEGALIETLRDYNGTPAELLADRQMMQLLLPGLRADLALSECYRYRAEPPLNLPIHVLLGEQDPHVDQARVDGWTLETTRAVRVHRFPGDHFFLHAHEPAIATLLVQSLTNGDGQWPADRLGPRT